MPERLQDRVLSYVRRHALLRAGDRVGVAVSGGADSVALLRLLLEMRAELGLMLSVVHFNHQIRGAEADADEQFVRDLAERFGLAFHVARGDAPAHALTTKQSLETAARELRYRYFRQLLRDGVASKMATAHTLDDQAETVLLRLLRGAGTRGLAGIFPRLSVSGGQTGEPLGAGGKQILRCAQDDAGVGAQDEASVRQLAIVRPLLAVSRSEIEQYLRGVEQPWREDASNRDRRHARNRVRHVLLPLLEREFNPAIRQVLVETAEIARTEEDFWSHKVVNELPAVTTNMSSATQPESSCQLDWRQEIRVEPLCSLPLALQRRLIRYEAEHLGIGLNFEHVEKILALTSAPAGTVIELPGGWLAERSYRRFFSGDSSDDAMAPMASTVHQAGPLLVFRRAQPPAGEYEYRLLVPGETPVVELGALVRASVVSLSSADTGYNRDQLLSPQSLGPELRVRNWRPGDRFWPARTKSARKVKELLQAHHVSGPERSLWPVVENSAGELIWMRGFAVPARFAAAPDSGTAVWIREEPLPA